MLSANPKNTNPLRLGEEARKIQSARRLAKSRDQFEIATEWAVRVEDLRRAMLNEQPTIVHFCGHGAKSDSSVLLGPQIHSCDRQKMPFVARF